MGDADGADLAAGRAARARTTSTRRTSRREREQVLHREWFCVGRLSSLRLGPADRQSRAVVDVAGESRAGHPRRPGRAARVRTTSAGTAARRSCRPSPAASRRSRAARQRCAAPTTRGPTTSTAGCCVLRTPRTSTTSTPAAFGLHPVAVGVLGRVPVPAPDASGGRAVGRRCSVPRQHVSRATRWTCWSPARRLTYDVAANYKVVAGELQRVLPLRPACTPSWRGWCRRSAGGGSDLDWDAGIPHREGAWTFTMTGTTDRRAVPRPGRRREGAAQGRAASTRT